MKVRGEAAFSISSTAGAGIVRMRAELLHGAQLNRSDEFVFNRDAQTETEGGCFKGTFQAKLNKRLIGKYLKSLAGTTAQSASPGISFSMESGHLQIDFLATPADRESWIEAKSGNRYIVEDFWLALGQQLPAVGAGIPPLGQVAHFRASLIFKAIPKG